MTDRAAMTTGCPQFGWVRILRRGVSHSPFCFAECVIARYLAICGRDANWRMKRAGMGYTSWVQLCEIDEVVSSRLTRYRSKDRAGWPPPPKLTDEAPLGRPQLRPQLFRVVLLEGTDDGELTYVGSDPRRWIG